MKCPAQLYTACACLVRTDTTRWTVHSGSGARYDIITNRSAIRVHVSAELLV